MTLLRATLFTHPACLGNRQFDDSGSVLSHDDGLRGFRLLKERLAQNGIDLSTQDINPPEDSCFTLFNEMPPSAAVAGAAGKRYLLLFESALIRPDNWDIERHRSFDKIFTWHDGLVDNKRYFKAYYACNMNGAPALEPGGREKLCVLIAGNKHVRSSMELYSHRVKAIRWFERNHPEDFDLYGVGWDAPLTLKLMAKALIGRFRLGRVFDRNFPSYRGAPRSKFEVLRKYRFSICYENVRGVQGYVTEKILDSLWAGCIPIYWGAPNIGDDVPPEVFIDFRNFKDYGELYRYLKGMPEKEYLGYLDAIRTFWKSAKARRFTHEFFAEQIAGRILEDIAARKGHSR